MTKFTRVLALAMLCVVGGLAHAADVSGTWTASFDTQVGKQDYTYVLKVDGAALSGTAKSNLLGDSTLLDGKVDGNKISFVENANFQGMPFRIAYTGQMTSADEIKFTRQVADIATENFTAKRVK